MAGRLDDKVAFVTGASSGIGRASAIAVAKEGTRGVVIADIDMDGLEETLHLVKEAGSEALALRTDVARAADVESAIARTVESFGRLDCALNNAGADGEMGLTHMGSEEGWDLVQDVNLKGTWLCMKYQILQMLEQASGSIVNMASTLGLVGFAGQASYVAAKHGVVGLTKAAALEYAPANIRVNVICPGVVHTPAIQRNIEAYPGIDEVLVGLEPVGRLGQPEEIAAAVIFLLSDEASFVHGHTLAVDGGFVAK